MDRFYKAEQTIRGGDFTETVFYTAWQTDWNMEGKIQGSHDIELNDTGIYQAVELSKKILTSRNLLMVSHIKICWSVYWKSYIKL